jgi:hypothetical protein
MNSPLDIFKRPVKSAEKSRIVELRNYRTFFLLIVIDFQNLARKIVDAGLGGNQTRVLHSGFQDCYVGHCKISRLDI